MRPTRMWGWDDCGGGLEAGGGGGQRPPWLEVGGCVWSELFISSSLLGGGLGARLLAFWWWPLLTFIRFEAAKAKGFKCIIRLGLASSSFKLRSSCSSEGLKVTVLGGELLLDLLEAEGEGEAVRLWTSTSSVD